jgi:hypothetical protein
MVGVAAGVGVDVGGTAGVFVGVLVGRGVLGRADVFDGTGVFGIGVTQPVAVQASQQLENPVVQLEPPVVPRHFVGLDFTEHLVRPAAVVRQQVTHPAGRPQVDLVTHFFSVDAQ